jgi:hypothetical protein
MPTRSRAWCFTHNNYTEQDEAVLQGTLSTWKDKKGNYKTKYCIYGREVGEEGTPHLQGYIQCYNQVTFDTIKKILGDKPHIEVAKGSPSQNFDYCSKDGDYMEFGETPKRAKGCIDQWNAVKDMINNLNTWDEIFDLYPGIALRNKKAIKETIKEKKAQAEMACLKSEYDQVSLYTWQEEVHEKLMEQDDRQILWVWDDQGNIGKTFFAKWLISSYGALYITDGKHTDHAYAWDGEDMVIFDLARTSKDFVPYKSIEHFKNGVMFSGKYESKTKVNKSCKVIVFANYPPDCSALSMDRWCIAEIC